MKFDSELAIIITAFSVTILGMVALFADMFNAGFFH